MGVGGRLAIALLVVACGSSADDRSQAGEAPAATGSTSPRPRPELVETLRQDAAAVRHPSDGGGRAWIDPAGSSPLPVTAGSVAHFTLVYEAGPLGVAKGGMVFLQPSAFWGWSPPQDFDPSLPGYTRVDSEATGLGVVTEIPAAQLFAARLTGRGLRPGERLRFHYGSPEIGARVDTFAERDAPIWIAVDGDGDGVRKLIDEPPRLDVVAGPAERLLVTVPSVAHPGHPFEVNVAAVDGVGNAAATAGDLTLTVEPTPATGPAGHGSLPFQGRDRIRLGIDEGGIYRIRAVLVDGSSEHGFEALSGPVFVTSKLPRVLWGDLHGHSGLSDGTGTPDDYFTYARDVAALDVAALTDHDHWGMRPLAKSPELWRRIQDAVARFDRPGEFVTLLGYEWTNWMQGHRHVLYFRGEGEVLSSLDPAYEHPQQLWSALRGKEALTFTHHSAGEPIPTNWEIPPDPELEPVAEIVSVHGSSEAADSPGIVRGAVPGNFVRDALDRHYRLGFIGSGDSHDGHPGLAGLAGPSSGLAAILSEELSRDAVYRALRARHVYATNGPRILLHVTLDGQPMGTVMPVPTTATESLTLVVLVLAPRPIVRIDLIRDGVVAMSLDVGDGGTFFRAEKQVSPLAPDGYLYVRALLDDGGAAWSSPFFGDTPS